MSRLGFGIAAALGPELVAKVAPEVERLGFATLWTNDVPGADGLVVARAALDATRSIDVGVGVIACDRRPAEMIAADIERLRLPLDRCIVGVGAGRSSRPLADVRACVVTLRERLGPGARIALAALGPRMCRLAGELADVVLLNWMTPERIRWAHRRVADGARRAGRDPRSVRVSAYVRAVARAAAISRGTGA